MARELGAGRGRGGEVLLQDVDAAVIDAERDVPHRRAVREDGDPPADVGARVLEREVARSSPA